jgi:hypothetical protein
MSEGRVGLSPRSIVIFYVPVPHTDTMDTEHRTAEYHLDSHRHRHVWISEGFSPSFSVPFASRPFDLLARPSRKTG